MPSHSPHMFIIRDASMKPKVSQVRDRTRNCPAGTSWGDPGDERRLSPHWPSPGLRGSSPGSEGSWKPSVPGVPVQNYPQRPSLLTPLSPLSRPVRPGRGTCVRKSWAQQGEGSARADICRVSCGLRSASGVASVRSGVSGGWTWRPGTLFNLALLG